ncbi:uncharacterized protein CTHT_0026630 [Thermochaetoides thermophila DSM 1495]|uniref:GPI-anchored cell surface glycoprotein n=1 Tax=Chaetomium thermophilum (strain DSM 1495 / CBS 144.50 / IMI 039719) TaxID=759272 RepID=G0S6L4_CHATD|nr:hypothetical protein CTHT_0026630 [Thermochaetoides thermophila DSM 1495]EGS20825.1 hypothetical protein CTHT_0026630 [Thermochaetoides thermophila DSM 1495]
MSLNGLDNEQVKEAFETAAAEPGGCRDEVELLGRGNGGIVELRNLISQYEEKSPLYGYLRYRRRNVIIRYLPEDCSRLIQARVTVHFEAVCDRFSPYDTVFAIADAKELTDTKLSAACSLHAASNSTSSTTSSVRRRRLMEIAEEEEEEERERKRQSVVKDEERPKSPPPSLPSDFPVKLDAELAKSPEASQFSSDPEPPQFTGVPRPSSPATTLDEVSGRPSSQTSRSDYYYPSSYPYSKPRVKLAPRPSAEGRPRSAAGAANRPISTLPANIKSLSNRKARSHSQGQDEEPSESIKEEAEEYSVKPSEEQTASLENDPVASAPAPEPIMPVATAPPAKQNTMTPEKVRLLKAMKLREKKMASMQSTSAQAADTSEAGGTDAPPGNKGDDETAPEEVCAEEKAGDREDIQHEFTADSESKTETAADNASVDTHIDSHATSPLAASDIGDSTQASSLSDSTDETLLAKEPESTPSPDSGETTPQGDVADSVGKQDAGASSESKDDQTENNASEQKDDKEHFETASGATEGTAAVAKVTAVSDSNDKTSPTESFVENQDGSRPSSENPKGLAEAPVLDSAAAAGDNSGKVESAPAIRLPVSKFSATSAQAVPAIVSEQPASETPESFAADAANLQDKNDNASNSAEAVEGSKSRRKVPEPIKTVIEDSEAHKRRSVISILDNDGFMDELQSAPVEQATPVPVAKSPLSSCLSVDNDSKKALSGPEKAAPAPRPGLLRTASNPVRNSVFGDSPVTTPRSASSGNAYLQRLQQQQQQQQIAASELRPKNTKLGSSISQRIKALEKLSGNANSQEFVPKERPSATFFAVRKASTREIVRSPSIAERANTLSANPSPSPPGSTESSPEARRGRSGSLVNRLSIFEGGMPPRGRPESVQVTARIVRDPNQPYPRAPESKTGDYPPLDLKQSPLVVDVHNRSSSRSPVRPSSVMSFRSSDRDNKHGLLEGRLSRDHGTTDNQASEEKDFDGPHPRRRSSLSLMKELIRGAKSPSTDNLAASGSQLQTLPMQHSVVGSLARHLSIGSRRSSVEQNSSAASNGAGLLSPSRTADGADSESEVKSTYSSGATSPNQSKGSRASRFMRRLSNTLTTGRKNTSPAISPTVAEENVAEVEAASKANAAATLVPPTQPTIVAYMGDVNVQFPDNLLWKRRSICLDSHGFLILSAVQGSAMSSNRHSALIKRYHMSDFKFPYAPDVELQELPNSVVLDFIDGSGLQIACEDRAGQMNVLKILQDAHRKHTSFGQ